MSHALNKNDLIPGRALLLCFVASLALVFLSLIDTSVNYPYLSYMMLTKEQILLILNNHLIGGFIGLFVSVMVIDYVGPKLILLTAFATLVFGEILLSIPNTPLLFLAPLFIGIASSFIVLGTLKLAASELPKKLFCIVVGLFFFSKLMSGFAFSSEHLFPVIPLLTTILSAGFFILFFAMMNNHPWFALTSPSTLLKDAKQLLKNRTFLIAIFATLIASSFFQWLGPPIGTLLLNHSGYDTTTSSVLCISFYFGVIAGVVLIPFFSQLIGNRKQVLMISYFLSAISIVCALFYPPHQHILAGLLFFLGGFFAGNYALLYAIANDVSSPTVSGFALGLIQGAGKLGYLATSSILPAVALSSASNRWTLLFSMIPLSLLLGVVGAFYLKESAPTDRIYPLQYLKRGWLGQLNLGRAFWLIHIGIPHLVFYILVNFLVMILFSAFMADQILTYAKFYAGFLSLPFLLYAVFSSIIVWRCAKTSAWQWPAKIFIILQLASYGLGLYFWLVGLHFFS